MRYDRGDDLPDQASGPQKHAAGLPAVLEALRQSLRQMGPRRTLRTLTHLNQVEGFDCPGCAWPDPQGHRHVAEFCENGAKAVAEEATTRRADAALFASHAIAEMRVAVRPLDRQAWSAHRAAPCWPRRHALPADRLGRRLRADRAPPGGARLAGRGDLLHLRAHQQRGRLPLPGARPGARDQQPAGLLEHVPRVQRRPRSVRRSGSARAASPSRTSTRRICSSSSARTRAPTTPGC